MNIGRLDREIELQSASMSNASSDGWNDRVPTWSTFATVWATRKDKSTSEGEETFQRVAKTFTEWTIRHRTDISVEHRIKVGNDFFYLTGIREVGRREGLTLVSELRDNGEG